MSVKQHLGLLVIVLLLLVCVLRAGEPHKPLLRFSRLDAALGGSEASETPSPEAAEAMEILIAEVARQLRQNPDLDDEAINRALEPYERAAAKDERDDSDILGFSWIAAHTARHGDHIATSVTYGAVSRLAVFDRRTGERLKVPAALEWLDRWHSMPTFFADGGLVVVSNSVQPGNRVAFRVDFLSPKTDGYRLVKSIERVNTLDFGGAKVKGNQLILESLADPVSFIITAPERLFEREEIYAVSTGVPQLIRETKKQPVFRFLDQWMLQARSAEKPDRLQRVFRGLMAEESMFWSYDEKRLSEGKIQSDVRFDEVTVRFLLQEGKGYRVLSVCKVR